jgi:Zn-dependent peptidase ImmA (M78 family)
MATSDNVIQFNKAAHGQSSGRLLIPARLTEARMAARMTQTELANAIGVSRQAISAYELDEKNPDPSTMKKISEILGQPISFFTKENRPTFGNKSALFFRKVGADTKRRNQACEVFSNWAASSAAVFDDVVNYPPVDILPFEPRNPDSSSYTEEEIEIAAETVRRHFGLGWGPISNMLRLMESKGVVVCRFEIEGENIEAFSYWSGDRPFVFLASDKESAARARFDAAHELGHLCLHRWVGAEEIEDKKRLKEIESEANRFAGAFLLPRKSFPNEIYSPRLEAFIDLKARWKVAIQAMIYRCKDLHLFDERQVTNLYKQISYKKWRTKEPLDGPNGLLLEKPALLRRIAQIVFESGRKSPADLMVELAIATPILEQLLGTEPGTFSGKDVEAFIPSLK